MWLTVGCGESHHVVCTWHQKHLHLYSMAKLIRKVQWSIIILFPRFFFHFNPVWFVRFCLFLFTASLHMSASEKALLLLSAAPEWKLAVFTVLNRMEVWSSRGLDRANQLCWPRIRSEWRRNRKTKIFLYHIATWTYFKIFEWMAARATWSYVEKFTTLVPWSTSHNWRATILL